ncbi:glycosyltransferase family 25 protein [Bartonella sp. LJL80]
MKNVKAFIIHLERAAERQAQVSRLIGNLPCHAEIIKAVDSRELGKADMQAAYRKRLYKPYYPFQLSANEIACFLSHRAAWQQIVDDNLEAGFVIEDDVELGDNFLAAFDFAIRHATPQDFIRFPFRQREDGRIIAQDGEQRLLKPKRIGLGQVAQLVGREAAAKLLQATRQFDRPVDTTMQLYWQTGVHPTVMLPPCVREISSELGGSTIKSRRGLWARIYREIARPLYRRRIAALSDKQEV